MKNSVLAVQFSTNNNYKAKNYIEHHSAMKLSGLSEKDPATELHSLVNAASSPPNNDHHCEIVTSPPTNNDQVVVIDTGRDDSNEIEYTSMTITAQI